MLKRTKKLNNDSGTTFIEVLLSVFILLVGIGSSITYFTAAGQSTNLAKDMMIATVHAEMILDEMRSLDTTTEVTDTDWDTWLTNQGTAPLTGQQVVVTYTDPSADLLEITTEILWTTGTRNHSVRFQTDLTKVGSS